MTTEVRIHRVVDRHPLYTVTTFTWREEPCLKTAAADMHAVREIVQSAEVGDWADVAHDDATDAIHLFDRIGGRYPMLAFVPVTDLDRRTFSPAEAEGMHLAEQWRYSTLHGAEMLSMTQPADRTELREALVRAARQGETVGISAHLIAVRNELGQPCAYLQPHHHPAAALAALTACS